MHVECMAAQQHVDGRSGQDKEDDDGLGTSSHRLKRWTPPPSDIPPQQESGRSPNEQSPSSFDSPPLPHRKRASLVGAQRDLSPLAGTAGGTPAAAAAQQPSREGQGATAVARTSAAGSDDASHAPRADGTGGTVVGRRGSQDHVDIEARAPATWVRAPPPVPAAAAAAALAASAAGARPLEARWIGAGLGGVGRPAGPPPIPSPFLPAAMAPHPSSNGMPRKPLPARDPPPSSHLPPSLSDVQPSSHDFIFRHFSAPAGDASRQQAPSSRQQQQSSRQLSSAPGEITRHPAPPRQLPAAPGDVSRQQPPPSRQPLSAAPRFFSASGRNDDDVDDGDDNDGGAVDVAYYDVHNTDGAFRRYPGDYNAAGLAGFSGRACRTAEGRGGFRGSVGGTAEGRDGYSGHDDGTAEGSGGFSGRAGGTAEGSGVFSGRAGGGNPASPGGVSSRGGGTKLRPQGQGIRNAMLEPVGFDRHATGGTSGTHTYAGGMSGTNVYSGGTSSVHAYAGRNNGLAGPAGFSGRTSGGTAAALPHSSSSHHQLRPAKPASPFDPSHYGAAGPARQPVAKDPFAALIQAAAQARRSDLLQPPPRAPSPSPANYVTMLQKTTGRSELASSGGGGGGGGGGGTRTNTLKWSEQLLQTNAEGSDSILKEICEDIPDHLIPPLLKRVSKKGKGGRQPRIDPFEDPTVDPAKAGRMLANRQSAARSKLKRRLLLESHRLRHELLTEQLAKASSEMSALVRLADDLHVHNEELIHKISELLPHPLDLDTLATAAHEMT